MRADTAQRADESLKCVRVDMIYNMYMRLACYNLWSIFRMRPMVLLIGPLCIEGS